MDKKLNKSLIVLVFFLLITNTVSGPTLCVSCLGVVCLSIGAFCGAAVYACAVSSGPLFFNCVSAACGTSVSALNACKALCVAPTP